MVAGAPPKASRSSADEGFPGPQPGQRRRVHVLRPRLRPRADGGLEIDARPEGHPDPQREARGGCTRSPRSPSTPIRTWPTTTRSCRAGEHRRRLWAAAGGARAARAGGCRAADGGGARERSPPPTWPCGCSRPEAETRVVPFDQILEEVNAGRADVGLIIHEGQLTYGGHGLHKVVDLGAWWKDETGLPLPLGANAVRRDLGEDLMARPHAHRARDGALLARPSRGRPRLRDELRPRHGPPRSPTVSSGCGSTR